MEKYVIDTNFFFNMEIKSGFGKNPKEVVTNFVRLAGQAKRKKKAEFFMPPSVIDEFLTFFTEMDETSKSLTSLVTVKSPEREKINFPATVFYKLVGEARERSYRGLRVAESAVLKAAQEMMGRQGLKKQEFEQAVGETIKELREKYRQATRTNFLDSLADLDLIVLAKEINGFLVSSDEGVIRWGRIFGVKEIAPSLLRHKLASLLSG